MITYVKKWGNSLAVRIPKRVSDSLRLREGSPFEFKETGGAILIKPISNRRQELAESFRRAAEDKETKELAESGLTDYLKQLKKFG